MIGAGQSVSYDLALTFEFADSASLNAIPWMAVVGSAGVQVVPEPSTKMLVDGAALCMLLLVRHRRTS